MRDKDEGSRNWGDHLFRLAESLYGHLKWCELNLDMKQRLKGQVLHWDTAVKNVRFLLERVNKRVFGYAYRKRGVALNVVAAVERGPVGGRLHAHGLIEVPAHVPPSEFRALMDKQWAKCRDRHGRSTFKLLTDDEAEQAWAGYVTKSGWQPDLIHIRKGSR